MLHNIIDDFILRFLFICRNSHQSLSSTFVLSFIDRKAPFAILIDTPTEIGVNRHNNTHRSKISIDLKYWRISLVFITFFCLSHFAESCSSRNEIFRMHDFDDVTKRVLPTEGCDQNTKRSKSTTDTSPLQHTSDDAPQTRPNIVLDFNEAAVVTPKRPDYLSWDAYFLAVAVLSAKRSKDPVSPSGACIVDKQNRIVGIGYNGFPRGCSDDIFPWDAQAENWLHTKNPYICHSVANAILNKSSDDVAGCRIYVMRFPSSDCSKMIIQSRITEVIVLGTSDDDNSDDDLDDDVQASRILLDMAGVKVRYCRPELETVELDFISALAPISEQVETEDSVSNENQMDGHDTDSPDKEARRLLWIEAGYDPTSRNESSKRKDYVSWQDYFMSMAFLTAQRSKDPNTQVGACIVDSENRIIGLGYNGFPSGCSDDCLPWARSNPNKLHNKYLYVCHAEVNAILNKGSANVKGATIYVALFPCENCAKMIIQSGIKEVVFMSDSYHDTPGCRASRIMLGSAGVKLRQHIPSMQKVIIKF